MRFGPVIFLLALLALTPLVALAQTETTSAIVGSITDKNGSVVSGAEIELTNASTNVTLKARADDGGQFIFPSVTPGVYAISISKEGFRKASVGNFKVDVAKSYTVPVTLGVGEVRQVAEVGTAAGVELRPTHSTAGNVTTGRRLPLLPPPTRL